MVNRTWPRVILGCLVIGLAFWLMGSLLPSKTHAGAPARPPRRIASLGLYADEMLVELAPHTSLVGLTRWVDDPKVSSAAGKAPPHAARLNEDVEQVLATQPDLVVLASYTSPETEWLLREAGVPIVRLREVRGFADIAGNLGVLGLVLGASEPAGRLRLEMERALSTVRRTSAPRTLLVGGDFGYGQGTFQAELLTRSGLKNALDERKMGGFVMLSEELLLALDPDVLVVEAAQDVPAQDPSLAKQIPGAEGLRAQRAGRVYALPRAWSASWSQNAARAVVALSRVVP
jgi:ABC-type Fe3+-hydroxamate transport system substrate-binding protein